MLSKPAERSCAFCGLPLLSENPEAKFCSGPGSSCRQRAHARQQALNWLVEIPEADFREEIRSLCRRRWGMVAGGRLHLRWGPYQERKPEEPIRTAGRRLVLETAESDIVRIEDRYLFRGWTAQALSWIAQYMRKLDRAAKLGAERKRREAERG